MLLADRYHRIYMLTGNEHPVFQKYRRDKNKRKFSQLVYYLKQNNYIKVKNLEGKQAILLTKKGISKALVSKWTSEERPRRKDRKWIMVIFDIPQKHPKARGLLRSVLKNMGYELFQQSAWVTPYDVFRQTEDLLQIHNLDGYVKIFLIEKLT